WLNWIPFDDIGALRASILDRRFQEAERDIVPANAGIHEKTRHGPHGQIVDPRQGAVAFQRRIGLPGSHGAPADRFMVEIRENSDGCPRADKTVERRHTALLGRAAELRASQPPSHAGAIAELAVVLGEMSEVWEPLGRDRTKFER